MGDFNQQDWLTKRFQRLQEIHPKNAVIRRAEIIGGVVGLTLAVSSKSTIYTVVFYTALGIIIGGTLTQIVQISMRGFQDGINASLSRAVSLAVLGGGISFLFRRELGDMWQGATLGMLLGHQIGFTRWWKKEVSILIPKLVEEWPLEEHQNEKYGFSIDYPQGWQISEENEIVAFGDPKSGLNFNLVVGPYVVPRTLEDYELTVRRIVASILTPAKGDFLESLEGKELPPGDLKDCDVPYAVEVIYQKREFLFYFPKNRKYKKFAFPRHGLEYIFTFGTHLKQFDMYVELFDRCIRSLGFKE